MIYTHSLGRAARYYPERTALASGGTRSTFRELHERVARIATALSRHGFEAGDRLAMLLPNEPEYIELVYACAWLGVIAVPLNTRLSAIEIDHVLTDASPRGLIRHSSLPVPTVQLSWQLVLDKEPLDVRSDAYPDPIYDPQAVLALVYTSGTTGKPKGVVLTHASILANVDHVNYWMPYREGGVYLHAAPIFHIADFPFMFASPAFGTCQVTIPKFSPQSFCETVERERVTHTVLVPTMINLLTQFADFEKYDLTSLENLGYGGSPIAPELIHRTRQMLPNVKLVQVYGLSETGFLTGLRDDEHTENRLISCGRPCPGIEVQVVDDEGKEVATGGENVYSGEVEAVIYQHPAVKEVAVFGIPDPKWGELVMACVVLKPGLALSADELISFCRRSLANYKVPRRVEFSETELPKNGSGKILKRNLRERFWADQKRAVG